MMVANESGGGNYDIGGNSGSAATSTQQVNQIQGSSNINEQQNLHMPPIASENEQIPPQDGGSLGASGGQESAEQHASNAY